MRIKFINNIIKTDQLTEKFWIIKVRMKLINYKIIIETKN